MEGMDDTQGNEVELDGQARIYDSSEMLALEKELLCMPVGDVDSDGEQASNNTVLITIEDNNHAAIGAGGKYEPDEDEENEDEEYNDSSEGDKKDITDEGSLCICA